MEQNRVYNTKPKKNLVTNELEHLKGKTDVGIFLILRSLSPRNSDAHGTLQNFFPHAICTMDKPLRRHLLKVLVVVTPLRRSNPDSI